MSIKVVYCKDVRAQISETNLISYDGRYNYFPITDPRSLFFGDNYLKFLEDVTVPLLEQETISVNELRSQGYTARQSISILLSNGYFFNPTSKVWESNSNNSATIPTRFIITSVINGFNLHPCYATLSKFAETINAELITIGLPYNGEDDYPVEISTTGIIYPQLQIINQLKLSVTKVNPLSGLDSFVDRFTIVGHPQLALKTLKNSLNDRSPELWTTGSSSCADYPLTNSGLKAKQNHNLGGLLVEIDQEGDPYIRPLCSDESGNIFDLGHQFGVDGSIEKIDYLLRPGDWHNGNTDLAAELTLYQLIEDIGTPTKFILEDFLDCLSINHHEAKNNFSSSGLNLTQELEEAVCEYQKLEKKGLDINLLQSNHHNFLETWLQSVNLNQIPHQDIPLFLELSSLFLNEEKGDLFSKYLRQKGVLCESTSENDNFKLWKVDHHHGHGYGKSLATNSRSAVPISQGHYHTPTINKKAWTVGTMSKLDLNYNRGASNWAHKPILEYQNGLRQNVSLYKGKYCA